MDQQRDVMAESGRTDGALARRRVAQLAALVSTGRGRHARRGALMPTVRDTLGKGIARMEEIRQGGNRMLVGGIIAAGAALSLVVGMVIGGAFAGVDVALPPASHTQQTPIIRYASPSPSTRAGSGHSASHTTPRSTTTVPSTTQPTTPNASNNGAGSTTVPTTPGSTTVPPATGGTGTGSTNPVPPTTSGSGGSGSGSGGTSSGSGSGTSSGSGGGTSSGSGGTGSGSGSGSTGGSGGTSPPPRNPLSGLGQALFG
ncbi:MAG TPA: hypothetical protein VE991_10035 [Acidimicrobiales bacterium]|nr:hypothetical protein [Acidimicrobiales bacterium]